MARTVAFSPPKIAASQTPRDRILYAAHALFYRDGIRGVGVDRIIAEAGVTKVTFYRQYRSKSDLVHAFLEERHQYWMAWITAAVPRHGGGLEGLVGALEAWFAEPTFRGCAFINVVGEMGGSEPAFLPIITRHKGDVRALIAALIPHGPIQAAQANGLALAVDGAIVRAAWGEPHEAVVGLRHVIQLLVGDNALATKARP